MKTIREFMKLKKRKIKFAVVDYVGSYALVEIILLLLVILPTWAVYKFVKE